MNAVQPDSGVPDGDPGIDARVACPACGALNASWHSHCDECGARLIRPEDADRMARRVERPGLLTGWAILFGGYVLMDGFFKWFGVLEGADFGLLDTIILLAIPAWMIAALWIILVAWRMRPWARIPAVMVHGVLIALFAFGTVYGAVTDDDAPGSPAGSVVESAGDEFDPLNDPVADVCGSVFWVGFNAGMAWWLYGLRDLFARREAERAEDADSCAD